MPGGLLFLDLYGWLAIVACLDVILTDIALSIGGREVNPIADLVIANGGLAGMIVFKSVCYVLALMCCEYVGRHRLKLGRRMTMLLLGLWTFPPVFALAQFYIGYFFIW